VASSRGTWTYDPAYRQITFSEAYLIPVGGWDGEEELIPDFDHAQARTPTTLEVRWLVGRLEFGGDGIPWGRIGGAIPHTKQPTPAAHTTRAGRNVPSREQEPPSR
jgi:hypothetical protein